MESIHAIKYQSPNFSVLIQPSRCSHCNIEGVQARAKSLRLRVLQCGCILCPSCSETLKHTTLITCPTCAFEYPLTDKYQWYKHKVNLADVESQELRCRHYRHLVKSLEENINELTDSDPSSDEAIDTDLELSDSSLEITSEDEEDYQNTRYAVAARRLKSLQVLAHSRSLKLQHRRIRASQIIDKRAGINPRNLSQSAYLRLVRIAEKKKLRKARRLGLQKARWLRLLSQHDVVLVKPQVKKPKKKKKKEKKGSDDEESEEEEEDDDELKKKPKKKPLLPPKRDYMQRWQDKLAHYFRITSKYEPRKARLERKLARFDKIGSAKKELDKMISELQEAEEELASLVISEKGDYDDDDDEYGEGEELIDDRNDGTNTSAQDSEGKYDDAGTNGPGDDQDDFDPIEESEAVTEQRLMVEELRTTVDEQQKQYDNLVNLGVSPQDAAKSSHIRSKLATLEQLNTNTWDKVNIRIELLRSRASQWGPMQDNAREMLIWTENLFFPPAKGEGEEGDEEEDDDY